MYKLSKSLYSKGIQCNKMLWLDENMPDKAQQQEKNNQQIRNVVLRLLNSLGPIYMWIN